MIQLMAAAVMPASFDSPGASLQAGGGKIVQPNGRNQALSEGHFAQAASKATTDLSRQKEAVQNPVQYPTVSLSKTQELDFTMLEIQRNPVPYDRVRNSRYPRPESNRRPTV